MKSQLIVCCLLMVACKAMVPSQLLAQKLSRAAQRLDKVAIHIALQNGAPIDGGEGIVIRSYAAIENWLYVAYFIDFFAANPAYLTSAQQEKLYEWYLEYFGPLNTALLQGIRDDNMQVVKDCLDLYGADVRAGADYALLMAAARGKIATVRMLIEHGGDVTVNDYMPIQLAMHHGQWEVVWYLAYRSLRPAFAYATQLAYVDWQQFLAVRDQNPQLQHSASDEILLAMAREFQLPALQMLLQERIAALTEEVILSSDNKMRPYIRRKGISAN